MRILLDHPAMRTTVVSLRTLDAQTFYQRFGFIPPPTGIGSQELVHLAR